MGNDHGNFLQFILSFVQHMDLLASGLKGRIPVSGVCAGDRKNASSFLRRLTHTVINVLAEKQ
jgi:hypothetical protein